MENEEKVFKYFEPGEFEALVKSKLSYVNLKGIIRELVKLVSDNAELSDDEFTRNQESYAEQGLTVYRFSSVGFVSIKLHDLSKYVSIVETVYDLLLTGDSCVVYDILTQQITEAIKEISKEENKYNVSFEGAATSDKISVSNTTIRNCFEESVQKAAYESFKEKSEGRQARGLIIEFNYADPIMSFALHDYEFIFGKWDKSVNNPVTQEHGKLEVNDEITLSYPVFQNIDKRSNVDYICLKYKLQPDFTGFGAEPPITVANFGFMNNPSVSRQKSVEVMERLLAFFNGSVDRYGRYSFSGYEGRIMRSKYTNVFVNNGKTVLMCSDNNIEFTRMSSFGSVNLIFSNYYRGNATDQEEVKATEAFES